MILALAVPLVAVLSGCASIILGGMQELNVRSNPSEAKVTVYTAGGTVVASQNTPCVIKLKRGDGFFQRGLYRLVVEKPGYKHFETEIRGEVNGWYIAGNIVFGGLIGWIIVDPATGAMWSLKPSEIDATLAAQNSSFISKGRDALVIVLKEQVPEDLQSCMTLLSGPQAQ